MQSGSTREAKGHCKVKRAGAAGAENKAKKARGQPSGHWKKQRDHGEEEEKDRVPEKCPEKAAMPAACVDRPDHMVFGRTCPA